jgi:prepilin-type N-terminal cleavage/methylation domain-containing protein/prepilin-type processing-associated H-X9-DG protein
MIRPTNRRVTRAFTLVELLVVMAIISLMVSLSYPALQNALASARSTQCAANLHSIGVAVTQAAADNDNQYPPIAQAATNPYAGTSIPARDLVDTLAPYGITTNSIQCPVDMAQSSSAFKQYGSSYEWNPAFDDEVTVTPIIYWSATVQIPVNSSRVRLCTDFNAIHNGRMNILYGDGHVRKH